MRPQEYLKKPYARIVMPDESGAYSAEILEFPGCYAEGVSPEEALEHLEAAAESWIESCLEQKQSIPKPFTSSGYGGKIALRLPKSVHRQAARMAMLDGVSLNQFLVGAVSYHIGARDMFSHFRYSLAAVNVTHLTISNLSLTLGDQPPIVLSEKCIGEGLTASTLGGQ